jgi:DNA-binding protein HU-beta
MQKTELIAKVAKDANVTQSDTAKIINTMIDVVVSALKAGEKVTLTGFGTFEVRETAARTGTNPSTREKIQIPAGKRAAFSAGAVLKGAVGNKAGGDAAGAKGGNKAAGGAKGGKAGGAAAGGAKGGKAQAGSNGGKAKKK